MVGISDQTADLIGVILADYRRRVLQSEEDRRNARFYNLARRAMLIAQQLEKKRKNAAKTALKRK